MLNQILHDLLERQFGEVLVVAEDEALQLDYVPDSRRNDYLQQAPRASLLGIKKGRPDNLRAEVLHSGEELRVSCPYCNDTRKRLFINHRWGVKDEYGRQNLWLAHCWNEECLSSYLRQKRLYELVFTNERPPRLDQLLRGRIVDWRNIPAAPPGPVVPLSELAARDTSHPAVQYLRQRRFDPDYLSERYQVGFCLESVYALAENRIYIPITMDGKLRGWQGDPPKYWSMPNMRRRELAYNWDSAVLHNTIVIVEGPADVWRTGPQALGCIGKTLSPELRHRLIGLCKQGSCVVMLDPKQDVREALKKRPC